MPSHTPCLLDVVIGCDFSGSMGDLPAPWNTPGNWFAVNDFVREFVTSLDHLMDGSIAGIPGSNNIQVGTYLWTSYTLSNPPPPTYQNIVVRNMTANSSLLVSDANIPNFPGWTGVILGHEVLPGAPDRYSAAIDMGMTMLNNFGVLGNRSSQSNYRRIMIIVTDAQSAHNCSSSVFGPSAYPSINIADDVWNVGSLAGNPGLDVEVYTFTVHTGIQPPAAYPGNVNCLVPFNAQSTNVSHGTGTALGTLAATLASVICDPITQGIPPSYECNNTGSPITLPSGFIAQPWDCYDLGQGLGTYSVANGYANPYNDCVTNCHAPIPVTYNCSGASGTGHPSGLQWQCYDPGTGLGTYQGLNAWTNCQSFCQTPVPITYDCSGPPNWNCSVVTGGGGQYPTQAACQAVCFAVPPSPSWHCTENATIVSQGVTYGPWTCYDPGTGLGQHSSLAACQNICVDPPSWDCHMPAPGTPTGICIDPGNGSGQYSLANGYANPEQDCIDACKIHTVSLPEEPLKVSWNCRIDKYGIGHCDLVLGTSGTYATKALCLAACETHTVSPGEDWPDTWKCHIPWHSTVGTCTKMTDGSGTYTTEQDCIDNCLHVRVTGSFEDTWGWNCDNSTQTCSGPVIGGTYPTQTDCQQYCVGTIGVGTLCDRIRSCPCGWTYDQTTQECESPGLTQTMIIDAIENCITFQNLPHQPVLGDIWANLSPSNIPPLYAWSAAEVVEVGGQLQAISSIETRSQC
jgi:hypothetical protein|tara:strand:+ start:298 stop:2520 length:2223 start_codon:yes stop_codon:yes gene_type:complete